MGTDRVANLIGGRELLGLPVCIIDFGTATTIDVLNKNNKYAGGLILPGIQTGAEALHNSTALLPLVENLKEEKVIRLGRSTEECIKSGIYRGEYERIKGLATVIRKQYNPYFIVTGGMGSKLAKMLDFKYNPWLTLYGLNSCII